LSRTQYAGNVAISTSPPRVTTASATPNFLLFKHTLEYCSAHFNNPRQERSLLLLVFLFVKVGSVQPSPVRCDPFDAGGWRRRKRQID
jgi:hypothetical protein